MSSLGPSWRRLGPSWTLQRPAKPPLQAQGEGVGGGVLGLSWDRLGALLGHRGAVSRPRKAIGNEKGEKANTSMFRMCLKDVGLSALSWGSLEALLGGLGALLRLFGGVWEVSWGPLGGHRSKKGGAFMSVPPSGPERSPLGALLDRSWAPLGRSWGRLGALLGRIGRLLGRLGALLGRLGAVLGASWAVLGRSWGPLGPSWSVGKPKRRELERL